MNPSFPVELCDALIHTRQHIGPKHLGEPGPDAATLEALFRAAAAAPDHGRITPWRFVVLGPQARERLGEVFAHSLLERDPSAQPEQCADARAKALRGAVLILVVARLGHDEAPIPEWERLITVGAAVQNVLLAAHARGWGCGLSGGHGLQSTALHQAFGLAQGERAVCCISLGTPSRHRPIAPRADPCDFVQWLV